ncbi:MAG: dTMP kinase [Pseudomonadota bacterium]
MPAHFITFEGGEGVGKTTQIALLAKRLEDEMGADIVVTREPGGSPRAEALRELILSGAAEKYGPFAEAVLFNIARADHIAELIVPSLEAGKTVICDRFMDSTRVYQGVSGDIEPSIVRGLEEVAVGEVLPDLTLVLDIDAKTAMERAGVRRGDGAADRFEKEALDVQAKRRKAFRKLPEDYSERCVLVDARGDAEAVADRVWEAVTQRLFPADEILGDDAMARLDRAVAELANTGADS